MSQSYHGYRGEYLGRVWDGILRGVHWRRFWGDVRGGGKDGEHVSRKFGFGGRMRRREMTCSGIGLLAEVLLLWTSASMMLQLAVVVVMLLVLPLRLPVLVAVTVLLMKVVVAVVPLLLLLLLLAVV